MGGLVTVLVDVRKNEKEDEKRTEQGRGASFVSVQVVFLSTVFFPPFPSLG